MSNLITDIEDYFSSKIAKIDQWLINLSKKRYWVLRLAVLLAAFSFILSPPKLEYLLPNSAAEPVAWKSVDFQMKNFLKPMPFHENSHEAKRVFRLTVPFLGVITGIKSVLFWTYFQIFLGASFFYFLLKITLNITGFSLETLYFNIGLVGCFFATAGITDTGSRFDGYSYFFILLAMVYRNPLSVFAFTLLASFCDERAFIACTLVFLWWLFQYLFKKIDKIYPLIAVILGMLTYLGLRLFLTYSYNLSTPSGDIASLNPLKYNIHFIPFGFLANFELYWFFIFIALLFLLIKRKKFLAFLYTGALSVITLVSFLVYDITSSLSYAFPLILIGFLILYEYTEFKGMKKYFLTTSIGTLLFPTYWIAIQPWYYLPLPVILLQYLIAFLF